MLPTDLAIFSSPIWTMPLCIQMRASGLPRAGLGLRDLVLVVREDEVGAAAVDVEVEPEDLLRHRRALDVPARPPAPQGESQDVSSPSLCAFQSAKS